MNNTLEFVKKRRFSILICIIVASIIYAGVSLIANSWKWYGQILAPLLGVVIYIMLELMLRGKNE